METIIYQSIWAEDEKSLKNARRWLRVYALSVRVNNEAYRYFWERERTHLGIDQTTRAQRMKFRDDINRDYRIARALTVLILISVVMSVILTRVYLIVA